MISALGALAAVVGPIAALVAGSWYAAAQECKRDG